MERGGGGRGGGGGIALYYSIQVFCSAEPTLFDIAPSSMQAITEQHLGHSQQGYYYSELCMVSDRKKPHFCCLLYYLNHML